MVVFPFWDRIILTATLQEAERLRRMLVSWARSQRVEDSGLYYNMVYSAEEWKDVHIGVNWKGEIAIDNADMLLFRLLGPYAKLALVTMTGVHVDPRI